MALSNPYDPPHAKGLAKPERWGAHVFLGLCLVLFMVSVGVAILSPRASTLGFAAAAFVAAWGLGRGVRILFAATPLAASLGMKVVTFASVLGNLFMFGVGALSAIMSTSNFTRGRQLRHLGRVLLPRVASGGEWAEVDTGVVQGDDVPAHELAAQWRENGRTEHASVAAFARLTLDLMALGAPPHMIAASNRDALDEIRHAELCFSLARALDGHATSPGPFPEASRARTLSTTRALALAELAVDSLVDGALNEGVSARILARLAKACENSEMRVILKEIAADEGRHAKHGWDVVLWCIAEGGPSVIHALQGAARMLPTGMKSPLPAAATDGSWERYGIHGHALEAAEYIKARADVVRRITLLASSASRSAA